MWSARLQLGGFAEGQTIDPISDQVNTVNWVQTDNNERAITRKNRTDFGADAQDAMEFGFDDHYERTQDFLETVDGNLPLSMFLLIEAYTDTSSNFFNSDLSAGINQLVIKRESTNDRVEIQRNQGVGLVSHFSANGTWPVGTPILIEIHKDASNNAELRVNGVQEATWTDTNHFASSNVARLGNANQTSGYWFYEWFICETALSATQKSNIRRHFLKFWPESLANLTV